MHDLNSQEDNLMRLMLKLLTLSAVLALAGMALAGPFHSLDKNPPVKLGADEPNRGLLDCYLEGGIDVGFHGTHCGGIAAAATNNAVGVAGAAPGCRVMALKVTKWTPRWVSFGAHVKLAFTLL